MPRLKVSGWWMHKSLSLMDSICVHVRHVRCALRFRLVPAFAILDRDGHRRSLSRE
jgi:hypothetical protein